MKVVEYWHGTIKNYRYDGDVSLDRALMIEGKQQLKEICPRGNKCLLLILELY